MRFLGPAALAFGVALIVLASLWADLGLPTVDRLRGGDIQIYVRTAGITVVVIVLAVAVWIAPLMWRVRRLRAEHAASRFLVSQRLSDLVDGMRILSREAPVRIPSFFILEASPEGFVIWGIAANPIARFKREQVREVKTGVIELTRRLPTINLVVDGPTGAPVELPVVPGRADAELFPVLDSAKTREIAADIRARIGLA